MPTKPVLPPVALVCAILAISVRPVPAFAAEPGRSAHAHPTARAAPAVAPPVPSGPLETQATLMPHPETDLIEAMAHAGQRLVAVGVDGLILLSDDQGLSWRQVQPPVAATLTAVAFSDDNNGWAIGHYGVVLHTTDAGETWTLALDGPRANRITLDAALAANQSDTERGREIDAARHLDATDPSRPFLLMQTDGSDTLRVIGDTRTALETQDGGKHWHPWSNAIDDTDGLPLLGLAERDGVVVVDGAHGLLLAGRPEDGLPRIAAPTEASLFGALEAGRFGFVIYGQQGNAFAGTLAQPPSSTKANAWRQIDVPTQNAFTAGLLKRDGTVLLGDSGGMTWTLTGKPDNPHLEAASPRAPFAILSMVEADDGGLILAGAGGVLRIEPPPPPPAPPLTPPLAPAVATPVPPVLPQVSQPVPPPVMPPGPAPTSAPSAGASSPTIAHTGPVVPKPR